MPTLWVGDDPNNTRAVGEADPAVAEQWNGRGELRCARGSQARAAEVVALAPGTGAKSEEGPAQPQFVEVVLPRAAEQQAVEQEGADIEVLIGQRRVLVRPGFDAQSLRRVLAVLEEG